ncbi:GNAT family N-acetyltransferase [Kitasatospora sp. NPDC059577]|uniref:GNAT family N-acetyltransferase n=1 Tax=Kitasatospora sp. NPDC059577 TaxID=3346873 RepID=UPI00368341ED
MRPDPTTAPLHSERLDLLPIAPEHAGELTAALADPALHAFTGGRPATAEEMRARCARLAAGSPDPAERWGNWVLRLRADGALIGYVQATVGPDEAELAWVVGTPWQRRGLATEAARALLAHLTAAGTTTAVAHIHPDHRASARVATTLGLRPTAHTQDGETRWQADLTRPDLFPNVGGLTAEHAAHLTGLVEECRPVLADRGMAAVQRLLVERGTAMIPAIMVTKALLGWESTSLATTLEVVELSEARRPKF